MGNGLGRTQGALIGLQCSVVSSKCCLCGDSSLRVYVLGYVTEIQDGGTLWAHLIWTNHGLSGMTGRVLANRNG